MSATDEQRGDAEDQLGGPSGAERIGRLLAQELGEQAAQAFTRVWRAFDAWDQQRHPGEGLRETKKRLTRQRISDVATAMFVIRGFDNVTVAEIAERVGVSEKTIYNYFPAKESLVYDQADEQLARLTAAVRDRPDGISPTTAFVQTLKQEVRQFEIVTGEARIEFVQAFGRMMRETPSLRAAWGEHRHRMVESLTEVLAAGYGVDPRDPEPLVAARALVSLVELYYDSVARHLADGALADELGRLVRADLDRAARLLETGFWSMQLLVEGRRTRQQLQEAAAAAEQARKQVLSALREARRAWRAARGER